MHCSLQIVHVAWAKTRRTSLDLAQLQLEKPNRIISSPGFAFCQQYLLLFTVDLFRTIQYNDFIITRKKRSLIKHIIGLFPQEIFWHVQVGKTQAQIVSRAKAIIKDCSHPAYPMFDLLPFGRRYRSIRTRTNRQLLKQWELYSLMFYMWV